MSLSKVKLMDNDIKYLVSGFVRKKEKENNIVIPMMISYIIMIYYWIEEKFTVYGDGIQIDSTKRKATMHKICGYNTVYGNHVIDINDSTINVYKWTFKIINTLEGEYLPICIGIDASNDKYPNDDFSAISNRDAVYYSIASTGHAYNHSNWIMSSLVKQEKMWLKGDIIKIILYVNEGTLHCQVNQDKMFIFGNQIYWSDRSREYNIAVSMATDSKEHCREIEIIKFETFCK